MMPGISGRHGQMNMVIMSEITEDVYIGRERILRNNVAAEAIKLTTRAAAMRVARYWAQKNNRSDLHT